MSAMNRDELLSSSYDGIQEYDNDLPRWWLALLWGTVLFGAFYICYYSFGPGLSPGEQLAKEMEEIQATQPKVPAAPSDAEAEPALLALVHDTNAIAKGKGVFDTRCAPCHGPQGQGVIGPNLTDTYWIHGAKITDTLTVVRKGVLDKGMLAWDGVIPPDDIRAVVAYIFTLRGTTPPNPKAPQGEPAAS